MRLRIAATVAIAGVAGVAVGRVGAGPPGRVGAGSGCGGMLCQWGWAMASSALAPGCCWGSRKRTRRALRHTAAGRCQSCRRSRLGAARRSGQVRQVFWNQPTSIELRARRAARVLLACQSAKGTRARPLWLRRAMASSVSACLRIRRPSRVGWPAWSARNPHQRKFSLANRLRCAPGWRGSRRTTSRVRGGQPERSARSAT